jgi:hypothetical protein
MNIETFRALANGMNEALGNLETFLKGNPYNQEEHPFRKVVDREEWQQEKITLWDRVKYKIKKLLGKY